MVSLLVFYFFGLLCSGFDGVINGVKADNCSDISTMDLGNIPQDQFISLLTDPCRYDKFEVPAPSPLTVDVEMKLHHLEAVQTQLTAYITVEYKYTDSNLNYENTTRKRGILGDLFLKNQIWTPNIGMKNHKNSTVFDLAEKDVQVFLSPSGSVLYTHKLVVKFYCSMNLQKFPFDSQKCTLKFGDWTYKHNTLLWNHNSTLSDSIGMHFSEFILDDASIEVTSSGEFSELTINLDFHRDVGYYMLDFFLPSLLLVSTAWVTFWLQADAGPPRATLGASTVIAFVTLHLGVAKDIPKVSYIKASDIWFLGISFFIFSSLAEFAFVNVIWRRKKIVELKKPTDKYIIKSAVMPKIARNDLRKYESTHTLWAPESLDNVQNLQQEDNAYNGVYRSANDLKSSHSTISIPDDVSRPFNWETMSPKEVAIWIDRKARIVFPILFLIFNIFYWAFVYIV